MRRICLALALLLAAAPAAAQYVMPGETPAGSAALRASVRQAISAAATLALPSPLAGVTVPVSGAGYTISLPTASAQSAGVATLVAQANAGPVDVCPAGSASIIDAASSAPLVANLCPSGQSGIVLTAGASLRLSVESSGNYHAMLAPAPPITAQAYFVDPANGNDNNPGTIGAPFKTIGKAVTAASTSNYKTIYLRRGFYDYSAASSLTNCLASTAMKSAIWLNGYSGISLSYYPPDGLGSAVLDSNNSATVTAAICVQSNSAGNNNAIIGLTFSRWNDPAIIFWGQNGGTASGSGMVAKWNTFINTNMTPGTCVSCAPILAYYNAQGLQLLNNYVSGTNSMGLAVEYPSSAHAADGLVISGNVIENASQGGSDQGDIYFINSTTTNCQTTGTATVSDNYLDRGPSSLVHIGIYFDAGFCNANVTGNVIIAPGDACMQNHGNSNIVAIGNICDLGTVASGSGQIVFYQEEAGQTWAMTGNVWQNNAIFCYAAASPCGAGYAGNSSPPNPMTIANNGYHNYGTGTGGVGGVNNTGSNGAGTETGATAVSSPQVTCWEALIAPASPLLAQPIAMPQLGYAWGPPGQIGPSQTGTSPSWGPSC
jgi:hypothetical protein